MIAEMDAVLAAPPDAIIVIDAAGTIRLVNPATGRVFGWKAHERTGNNVRMLMPEPFRIHHDSYLHNYLSTGRARIIGLGREGRALRRDGSIFPRWICRSVRSPRDRPAASHRAHPGHLRAQTHGTRAGRNPRPADPRLARRGTLGEMASGIAHEVNQPLTAISTYASACRRCPQSQRRATRAEILEFLNDIAEEGITSGTSPAPAPVDAAPGGGSGASLQDQRSRPGHHVNL
ncbi:MAG: PAS domain S-box protein [Candidatus Eisenbacteria bacterium]